jgi:hypothetical protein
LLRGLVILLIVYLVFRFLARQILPLLLGDYISKKMSEMQQNQNANKNYHKQREGEVTIEANVEGKKKYSKNSGEYVDYEEVK